MTRYRRTSSQTKPFLRTFPSTIFISLYTLPRCDTQRPHSRSAFPSTAFIHARRLRESSDTTLDSVKDVVDLALGDALGVGGNLGLDGGAEGGGGGLEVVQLVTDDLDGVSGGEGGLLVDGAVDGGVDGGGEAVGAVGDGEGLGESQAGDGLDLGVLRGDLGEDSLWRVRWKAG